MTVSPVGTPVKSENTNGATTAALTVPTGVTTSHFGVITTQTVDPGSDTVTIPGWTRQVSNPTGKGNEEIAVFTRDAAAGGVTAGDTITATFSAGENVTIYGRWWDTQGRGVESVGTPYTRNGVSGTTTQFPGVAVAGPRDVILVGLDRTTGSPTVSSWSPSTPADVNYTLSTDRSSRAHGALTASYAQTASGTTPTFTVTLSVASGNGMGVQLILTAAVEAYTDALALSGTGTLTLTGSTSQPGGSLSMSGAGSLGLGSSAISAQGALALSGTGTLVVAGPSPVTATLPQQWEMSTTALSLGWTVSGGTTARAVVSINSNLSSPIYGSITTIPASKWATSRVTGLITGTLYYVGLQVDGSTVATGRGQYRTLKSGLVASKVVTGSCQTTGSNHAVFDQLAAEGADFFAHQGDIHYADLSTYSDSAWRSAFTSSLTATKFATALSGLPWAYAADNHDGPGSNTQPGSDPWSAAVSSDVRELSGEVYETTTQGFYRTWVHAGVRYVMLDTWSFRSASTDANSSSKTMLGMTQRAWFLNLLQTATEPAVIVFSHFPHYSNLVAGGRWGDFPDERVTIGNAIAALPTAQRNKIVFVGGDSHSINADDGTNAMWNRPSLNASPFNQSGGLASGTWNIANIDVPDTSGVFSRLTFTPGSTTLAMTWDAVDQTGTTLATWTTSFPTGETRTGSLALSGGGSLVLSGSPAQSGGLVLAGSGGLALSGQPRSVGSLALGGTGTLVVAAQPGALGALTLAGSGGLTLGSGSTLAGTLALAGVGSLTLVGAPHRTGALTLAGTGTLVLLASAPLTSIVSVWDGSTWQPAPIQVWDGAGWRPASITMY